MFQSFSLEHLVELATFYQLALPLIYLKNRSQLIREIENYYKVFDYAKR
ncbi:hypothetical protein HWC13_gp125 [Nodularia phage vB_NspS-kac68v161]|uniref:Uncharacterized protein n=1 Tax=Nodularia phage vB_NspS-kac68v161 TaxID=2557582 RepID=A0A482MK08_9CAUD|nr:hypothetical protein HWC13_gp125 [Nodularia phage vB_NspS-kac68v161]QBQ73836.1 hypothetical protein kac68v161_gp186 [Nodularia phage vB_NspS-kac68v161]